MATGRRQRSWLIAGASLALHLVVLAWLARPAGPVATAPPAMIVELVQPSPRPSRSRPVEHRESPRRPSEPTAVSPPTSGPPALPRPAQTGAAPGPFEQDAAPAAADAVRSALRASVGCARPAGLTRQEREACVERLGRLAPGATGYAAPMDPAKRAYFDEVAAAGPTGGVSTDEKPGAVTPDHPYARFLKCSVQFGPGRRKNDYQGAVRLGRLPCSIPLQGSVFTPEAMVRKR